jgi:hypothetical protein
VIKWSYGYDTRIGLMLRRDNQRGALKLHFQRWIFKL